MKTIHRCVCVWKQMLFTEEIGTFYVLIWNIAGSSTHDRNFLCLSTCSAALHLGKNFYHSWKIHRSFISMYERTYYSHICHIICCCEYFCYIYIICPFIKIIDRKKKSNGLNLYSSRVKLTLKHTSI